MQNPSGWKIQSGIAVEYSETQERFAIGSTDAPCDPCSLPIKVQLQIISFVKPQLNE